MIVKQQISTNGGKKLKIDTNKDPYIQAIFESYGEDIKYKTLDDILKEYNINCDKEELEYVAYKYKEYVGTL